MLRSYYLVFCTLGFLLGVLPAHAQTEPTEEKDYKVNITITKDGETQTLTLDGEAIQNLKGLVDEVELLEDIEIDAKQGDIEIVIRSGADEERSTRFNFSGDLGEVFARSWSAPEGPFLGITGTTEDGGGVKLKRIIPNTGAAKAGLKAGDVVLKFDGEEVSTYDQLVTLIRDKEVGDQVKLRILREGKKQSVSAKLGERQSEGHNWTTRIDKHWFKEHHKEGLNPMTNTEERAFLGIEFNMSPDEGVLIRKVLENTAAAAADIKEGDKILSVNGTATPDGDAFRGVLKDLKPGDKAILRLMRDGREVRSEVILGKRVARFPSHFNFQRSHTSGGANHSAEDINIRIRIERISEDETEMVRKALDVSNPQTFDDLELDVYPNPGPGNYTVKAYLPGIQSLDISLLDQGGKRIRDITLNNDSGRFEQEIDISGEPNGFYFLVLQNEAKMKVEKLIKE